MQARAGEEGRLFGSVTNLDVERLLAAKGVTVDRRRILLDEPIKQLGTYPVVVQIGRDVRVTVQVIVEAGRGRVRPERRGGGRVAGAAGRRSRNGRPPALAPYAMPSRASRGRRHPEPEHPFRMVFQRDRDRIIHSTAFRRLEYKTQVFVNHEGDYYRTRLTHTMEAAQMTRTLARALGLNEDLAEAVALAHDLGHTPFGHAGERTLDRLMAAARRLRAQRARACASSRRSRSAIRDFRGLNLSWEVREGIVKHSTRYDRPQVAEYDASLAPCLEAQIVDFADEIAYNAHDVDDGLKSGMLDPDDLATVPAVGRRAARRRRGRARRLGGRSCATRRCAGSSTGWRRDLVETLLGAASPTSASTASTAVRAVKPRLVEFSADMTVAAARAEDVPLRAPLHASPGDAHDAEGRPHHERALRGLHAGATAAARRTCSSAAREQGETVARVVADYIAGMTDRFALEEYKKLFDPYERV